MLGKVVKKLILFLNNLELSIRALFWHRQKDVILFGAWFGTKFADNSRFLFQYLDQNKDVLNLSHVVWVTRNNESCDMLQKMGYEAYMLDSLESYYFHKKAAMHIICNSASNRNGMRTDIRPEFSYGAKRINLWHGVGVVKGVGCASLEYKKRKKANKFIYCIKESLERVKWYRLFVQEKGGWGDFYFLSPTYATTKQFEQFSYIPKRNFIQSLYPRNCPCPRLTTHEQSVLTSMNNYKKIILYLPTFRTGKNTFNFRGIAENLKEILIEKEILWIQKAHSASPLSTSDVLESNILNLNPDFDINVIIPYISMLVTDYSSAASDARYFHKPVLFYVPDLDEYMNGDNGVTEDALELMSGPKFYDINGLRNGIELYINDMESAKPNNYEEIRNKYWGEEKNLEQIWEDIIQITKYY